MDSLAIVKTNAVVEVMVCDGGECLHEVLAGLRCGGGYNGDCAGLVYVSIS